MEHGHNARARQLLSGQSHRQVRTNRALLRSPSELRFHKGPNKFARNGLLNQHPNGQFPQRDAINRESIQASNNLGKSPKDPSKSSRSVPHLRFLRNEFCRQLAEKSRESSLSARLRAYGNNRRKFHNRLNGLLRRLDKNEAVAAKAETKDLTVNSSFSPKFHPLCTQMIASKEGFPSISKFSGS